MIVPAVSRGGGWLSCCSQCAPPGYKGGAQARSLAPEGRKALALAAACGRLPWAHITVRGGLSLAGASSSFCGGSGSKELISHKPRSAWTLGDKPVARRGCAVSEPGAAGSSGAGRWHPEAAERIQEHIYTYIHAMRGPGGARASQSTADEPRVSESMRPTPWWSPGHMGAVCQARPETGRETDASHYVQLAEPAWGVKPEAAQ